MIKTPLSQTYKFIYFLRKLFQLKSSNEVKLPTINSEIKTYTIEFDCWDNDHSVHIQLEPEAFEFSCKGHDKLRFVAQCDSDFLWAVRFDRQSIGVQLYPETRGKYDVQVFLNGELIF